MAGAISTRPVLDGSGALLPLGGRFFDVSGTGAGPWVPVSLLYDPASGAVGTIKGASTAPAVTDTSLVVAQNPNSIDLGSGTGGSKTQRVMIDTSQISSVGAQVTAASVSVAPATDIATVPVSQDTSKMLSGNTALTPLFAPIVASSSGVTNIVALTASKKIRVLQWIVKVNAAVNFKFQSHATPTDLTGLHYCGSQGDGAGGAFNPLGHFQTVAGEALDINLSGAVAVGGYLVYVLV